MADNPLAAAKLPGIGDLLGRVPVVGGILETGWDAAEWIYKLGQGAKPSAAPPNTSLNMPGGGYMPDNLVAPTTKNDGWFAGQGQWYDPGEWGASAVAGAGNGSAMAAGAYPGCRITLPVQMRQRAYAPPGYVVVRPPAADGTQGAPIAMLKSVARACGLWKAGPKPPIKARDWKNLKRAEMVARKLDTVVKTANRVTGKASYRRVRPGSK